jgi:hypothetical protein
MPPTSPRPPNIDDEYATCSQLRAVPSNGGNCSPTTNATALGKAPPINPARAKYQADVRRHRIRIAALGIPAATAQTPAIKNNHPPTIGRSEKDCTGCSVRSEAIPHRTTTGAADADAIPNACLASGDMRSNDWLCDRNAVMKPDEYIQSQPCTPCVWAGLVQCRR